MKSRCKCQPHETCDWSENLVNQLLVLPKNDTKYRPFADFFRERVCDGKLREVYCCNGDWPKESEVKNLKDCATLHQEEPAGEPKGQLISKCPFGLFKSTKKQTKYL